MVLGLGLMRGASGRRRLVLHSVRAAGCAFRTTNHAGGGESGDVSERAQAKGGGW